MLEICLLELDNAVVMRFISPVVQGPTRVFSVHCMCRELNFAAKILNNIIQLDRLYSIFCNMMRLTVFLRAPSQSLGDDAVVTAAYQLRGY